MELGLQIKKRRTELNMTQEQLAQKLDVSRSAISNWEIGRNYPDIQLIVTLSDILGISLDNLLKGDTIIVNQISHDTILRKKQSKKIKILYGVIILFILVFSIFLYQKNNFKDISNGNQIKSAKIIDKNLIITTDLPKYRSLISYFVNKNQNDSSIIEVSLSTKFDFSLKNNNSINLSRVPRPYFNMGVGECVLTDTLTFPLIPNILFYCVQTVFTNR